MALRYPARVHLGLAARLRRLAMQERDSDRQANLLGKANNLEQLAKVRVKQQNPRWFGEHERVSPPVPVSEQMNEINRHRSKP
jgi:hypothetical protein